MKSGTFQKIDRALALALKVSSVGCLVALLAFITSMIFVRFVPISSMGWADEIVEMAFAYMVFLGTASLWRDRTHFRVDMVPLWLRGSRAGRVLDSVVSLLALAFFLVFTYEGGALTKLTTDHSPILDLPRILWYMIMPITGTIMVGYTIRDLLLLFGGRPLSE
jgi:TRAP-type C4-dicarboxylate transport system permease small subunit